MIRYPFWPAPSLLLLVAFQAVGVLRVDAEDADLAGEEIELFEGEADVVVLGVALDLGIELGGVERPPTM